MGRAVVQGETISFPPKTYQRPAATGQVLITGTPTTGQVLTASGATWSGSPTVTNTWTLNNIQVGTGPTYTVPAGAVGKQVRVVQRATVASGLAAAVTSQPVTVTA